MAISAINNNVSFKGFSDMTPDKARQLADAGRQIDEILAYTKDTFVPHKKNAVILEDGVVYEPAERNAKVKNDSKNAFEIGATIVGAAGVCFLAARTLVTGATLSPKASKLMGKFAAKTDEVVSPLVQKGIKKLDNSPKKIGKFAAITSQKAVKFAKKALTFGVDGEKGMEIAGKNLAALPLAAVSFAKVITTDGDGNGKKDCLEKSQNMYVNAVKATSVISNIVSILS